MKKLSPDEQHALIILSKYPSFAPGLGNDVVTSAVRRALDMLVRKGRVEIVEVADAGPVYRILTSAVDEARALAEAAL